MAPVESTPTARALREQIDPGVDPCADFYTYACGGWIRRNPPRAPDATWSVLDAMTDADDDELMALLAEPRSESPWQFYRACLTPENSPASLSPLFAEIDAIASADDVPRAVGFLARSGVFTLFDADLHTDPAAAERLVFGLRPAASILSDRAEDRSSTAQVVERQLVAAGLAPTGARAILRFEEARARAVEAGGDELRPPALRGRHARWRGLLTGLGADEDTALVLHGRGYLDALDRLLRRTSLATVRAWLRWRTVDMLARHIGEAANEPAQARAGVVEAQMQRPQWCAWHTAEQFPAELGAAFVARAPGADGLTRARALVAELQVLAGTVGAAPRVGDAALHAAMARRLAGLTVRVGHAEPGPTAPLSGDHVDQVLTRAQARTAAWLAAAGKPSRHDRWESLQFLPTAFHDPWAREVSLGVGILRPPVFGSDALEVGALGGIAAHEMTHALVSGFTYDGPVAWDDPLEHAFAPAVACLAAPDRTGFTPTDGDVREALADLGGLRLAFLAHRARQSPPEAAEAAGLSADQRLFVGYAGFFCGSAGPEADPDLRDRIDALRWRIDLAATHLPELRAAFACTPPPTPDACMPW